SSIHWREAWKYGERAFRYCQHDIGHAVATVRYAAAALGWKAKLLDASDATIADVLGLAREQELSGLDEGDREHPATLLLVGPDCSHGKRRSARLEIADIKNVVNSGTWTGRPNALSSDHIRWPAIDVVAQATWRPEGTTPSDSNVPATQEFTAPRIFNKDLGESKRLLAVGVIQQRRSAVALDDSTSIPSQTFYGMLDRLLPRSGIAPWDVLAWPPHVHCGILMHRVDGL